MKKILFLSCIAAQAVQAQTEHQQLLKAAESYLKGDFAQAAGIYERLTLQNPNSLKANYNLGNAFYEQKNYDKSIEAYEKAAGLAQTEAQRAQAYHNLGNSYLQKQDFGKAVEAYKNALRQQPDDADTKNNLAYALRQQQQQQQQQKNQQQNQDNQNKEQKEQKEQPQNNQPQQEKKDREKPMNDADKTMEIMENEEKNTQKKLKEQQKEKKSSPTEIEKDW